MYKNSKVFIVLFLFSSLFLFAQTGEKFIETTGNFSFRPPLNWNVMEFPGLKYKVVFGPAEDGFTANINFIDETFNGDLKNYVDQNLAVLSRFLPDYRLLSREPFSTHSGIAGEKIVVNSTQHGFFLRQISYFLPARNNVYFVITCSVLDSVAAKYVLIFEESLKTFELIP